ncbi:GYF domain-containing protein [Botrimarina sp.]|uniref:GYF domain-containing protein n=1 Tax=Botrimarina sp. TaxID=2795802 RepID=UPI0032EFE130
MPGGEQHGPTVPVIFAQWIVAGRVPPDALVWRTGWEQWRTAQEAIAELPAPLPVGFEAGDPPPQRGQAASAGAVSEPESAGAPPPRLDQRLGGYAKRRELQARRRRWTVVILAVACVGLAAMLVWLARSGPPAGAPVVAP